MNVFGDAILSSIKTKRAICKYNTAAERWSGARRHNFYIVGTFVFIFRNHLIGQLLTKKKFYVILLLASMFAYDFYRYFIFFIRIMNGKQACSRTHQETAPAYSPLLQKVCSIFGSLWVFSSHRNCIPHYLCTRCSQETLGSLLAEEKQFHSKFQLE